MGILAAILLSAQASAAPLQPHDVFSRVCMEGGAEFSESDLRPVAYADLPAGARRVLAQTREALHHGSPEPRPWLGGRLPYTTELPGRLYRFSSAEAFLIPPQGGTGDLGSACAVVWRGDDYRESLRAIWPAGDPVIAQAREPSRSSMGLGMTFHRLGDKMLVAAGYRGWTVLLVAPPKGEGGN